MLPYVRVADLVVFGIHLHPFGLLVAIAVIVGTLLARWRAKKRGLDLHQLESFIGWMLFGGFASAHVLDEILYRPHEVLARPWSLLFFWEGIGSFSGFLGALIGVVLWRHFEWKPLRSFGPWQLTLLKRPTPFSIGPFTISKLARRPKTLPILPFADLILSVFPVAWIFGRAGCSIAHDHPGAAVSDTKSSIAQLAVAFPSSSPSVTDGPGEHWSLGPITVIHGHFARYDLGTLELFVTIVIAALFVSLWRRRLITGAYVLIVALLYSPARFAMDFLRITTTDPRYGGLTPAQWMCLALFVFGLVLIRHVVHQKREETPPQRG